ncbi:MAG TPA: ATPase, T2SS/T4P/T4SS family [Acidimicrobiales bacterium]|nr:ATPase, T2SS/T4P/T4SS family [Acidimicrobiales bacterium]
MTDAIAQRVRARLVRDVDPATTVDATLVARFVRDEAPLLDAALADAAVADVLADVLGLGALEPLLRDPEVSEVMVNGPGRVWVERAGALEPTPVTLDTRQIEHIIEKIVGPLGLRVDRSSPAVDARLADGSRVHAIVPPLAVDGPYLTIRRFRARVVELAEFCDRTEVVTKLREVVAARRNVIVCGGTGSGKTTLLNALASAIPSGGRIVTVEDAAELRLHQDHVVRLEARPANAEGVGRVTIRELVRNALRMRPDRIIVGECRGAEALDMLTAMNTGHEGSMSTCHANSPLDALRRLETMVLLAGEGLPLDAVRDQLHAAIDVVIEVARGRDGRRRIRSVVEVAEPGSTGPRVRPLEIA